MNNACLHEEWHEAIPNILRVIRGHWGSSTVWGHFVNIFLLPPYIIVGAINKVRGFKA